MAHYIVTVGDKEFDIKLEAVAGGMIAEVNGEQRKVDVHKLQDTRSLLLVENRSLEVDVRSNGATSGSGERVVFMRGREIPVRVEDYSLARMRKTAGISTSPKADTDLKAPMPGLVVKIEVEPGQQVPPGAPLVIIEAMKMENVLKATAPVTIKSIAVEKGQSVEKGDTLLEFE